MSSTNIGNITAYNETININNNNSLSWEEKLQRFFVCFVLINHYWFVYDWAVAIVSGNTDSSPLQLTPILSSGLATIIYLIYFRKRIKKRCNSRWIVFKFYRASSTGFNRWSSCGEIMPQQKKQQKLKEKRKHDFSLYQPNFFKYKSEST